MKTKKKVSFATGREQVSMMKTIDKRTGILFLALFAASLIVYWVLLNYYGFSVYMGLPVMAIPFAVIGLIYYVLNRRYYAVIATIAISAVAYFIMPTSVLFIIYLLICTEGVAQMTEIVQRQVFYGIIASVERVNIKKKMSLKDRIVVFFFNIPVDLDTRNLMIDRNVSRNKLPWRDMCDTILLALLFCMFLWIYVFLNPSFSIGTSGVPIYTFTIVLYLSMLVMPWSIFNTLDVRIATEYRDFKLYSGLIETFKRMFLPILAAMLFLIAAVNSGPDGLYYVGMSLVMIVVMIIFTSVLYYTSNESSVVNDILDRWQGFHPSEIYSGYSDSKSMDLANLPGTPKRDPRDCFQPELRVRSR